MRCWDEEKVTRVSQVPGAVALDKYTQCSPGPQCHCTLLPQRPLRARSASSENSPSPEPGGPGQAQFGLTSCPEVKMGTRRRLRQWLRCP